MAKRPARRNGPAEDPEALSVTQPIQDVEKLRRYHAELGEILKQYDTERSPFDRVSHHVRRHLPLYALGAVFALIVVLVPTTNDRGGPASSITAAGSGDFEGFESESASGPTEVGAQVASRAGRLAGRTAGGAVGAASNVPVGEVTVGAGVTRGGFECGPGVRQLPYSAYAYPCVGAFEGSNGGATYRGVDDKTIKIVVRKTADSGGPSAQTVDEANKAAGSATRTEALEFAKKYWVPYFNKTMELFGRQVVLEEFGSTQSNGVDEAQSKGKDGACADATAIADRGAFGVLAFTTGFGESQPFAQCAAELEKKNVPGLFVPIAAAYFPEGVVPDPFGLNVSAITYRAWDPFAWHIAMECEQIAQDVAEYGIKRLLNRKAKWARADAFKIQDRVFGTYVPDNDGYQHCVNIFEKDFEAAYGKEISRYNYPLDVSRFPDSAAQGVLQFQRDGVTTLINACDTISTRLMTEQADKVGWGPEWFLIGVATQDTNGQARNFNKAAIDGHMFGMSQLGPDEKIEGKDSEAMQAFKLGNPNVEPPLGALRLYYPLLHFFNLLQAAGPVLTPRNIAVGAAKMPPGGGAQGALGTWSLAEDHTQIDDSREIYWNAAGTGFDGKAGTFVETMGGARFGTGEWPEEEPPIPVK